MDYEEVSYHVADRVLTVTLERAEQRNTVTYRVLDELLHAFARAGADDEARAVVVTGGGEWFSAGTDLSTGTAGGGFDVNAGDFKPLPGGTRMSVANWPSGSSIQPSR